MKITYKRWGLWTTIVLSTFFIMIFSLILENISSTVQYIFDPAYKNALSRTFSNPLNFFMNSLTESIWPFDYCIAFGTYFFQFLIPFYGALISVSFGSRYRVIKELGYPKRRKFKKTLWSDTLLTAIFIAFAIFMAFLLYFLFCVIISDGDFTSGYSRPLFLDWFGDDFYVNHRYIYTLLEGFLKFFVLPLSYGLLGIGCVLFDKKNKALAAIPLLYYFGLTILGSALMANQMELGLYFNPTVLMSAGDFSHINTFLIILINSIPMIAGLLLIRKKGEQIED